MIPKECKRLAEVDFPIAVVSKFSAEEKEARCGHVPKIHIWPAARPTAACRSILLACLLPAPSDANCPAEFKNRAREVLRSVFGKIGHSDEDLQNCLLRFIGEFADWSLSTNSRYLTVARELV